MAWIKKQGIPRASCEFVACCDLGVFPLPLPCPGFTGVNTAKKSFFSSTYPLHKAAEMGNAKMASPSAPEGRRRAPEGTGNALTEMTGQVASGAGRQPGAEELGRQDCSASLGPTLTDLLAPRSDSMSREAAMQKKKGESHKEASEANHSSGQVPGRVAICFASFFLELALSLLLPGSLAPVGCRRKSLRVLGGGKLPVLLAGAGVLPCENCE